MRVLHVITRLIVGGAQENTIASVLGLRQRPGVEVKLLAGPSKGSEGSLESQFDQTTGLLQAVPHLVRPLHPWADALAWRELLAIFRREQPEIVHTHSGKAGFLGRLAAAHASVPVIVHTIHGPSFGNFQGTLANRIFRAAERRAGRVTTRFVSVADAMTQQYLAAGIGTPGQYVTIRSGFPMEPFLESRNDPMRRARLGIAPDDIVVGKIARLFKLKGYEDLFRAAPAVARSNPRVKFLVVGDGPRLAAYRAMANAETDLKGRMVFTGLVSPGEIPEVMGIMDLVVHFSRREGLARVLPQASAASKPIVAADCDGAREICLDGETGFLVPPGDTEAMADRMSRLAGDIVLREKLGARGRELVRGRFGVEPMVDSLYGLYLTLVAEARAQT